MADLKPWQGGSTGTNSRRPTCAAFKRLLQEKLTLKPMDGSPFVNIKALARWMETKDECELTINAGLLVDEVYQDTFPPRITTQEIIQGEGRCICVFSILLELDCGELIHEFRRAHVIDSNLPFQHNYHDLELNLQAYGRRDARQLIESFSRKKREYCPVEIEQGMDMSLLRRDHVLPFCKCLPVNLKGGTAQVFQILLPEDFAGENLRETIRQSRFKDETFGWCYEIALKTYPNRRKTSFREEVWAFRGLQGQKGMVQYLGNYTCGENPDDESSHTHNILLEFGQFDLDEYFAGTSPPIRSKEIINFWESMFKVADALQTFHNLEVKKEDGTARTYNGWHADIKPDNILRVHGEFKLADFGFAKFKPQGEGIPMHEFLDGATMTYCAPERDLERIRKGTLTAVSQAIDTWSLGCVFSITATWIILGWQGVIQFQQLREQAIHKLHTAKKRDAKISIPTVGDAFHNGQDVLPEISYWHDYLRSSLRRSDTITQDVLDLIDHQMLCGSPSKREGTKRICEKLEHIKSQAGASFQKQISQQVVKETHPTILKALLEYDRSAHLSCSLDIASNVTITAGHAEKSLGKVGQKYKRENGRLVPHQSINTHKSKRLGKDTMLQNIKPSKTANRSQIIPEELGIALEDQEVSHIVDSPSSIDLSQLLSGRAVMSESRSDSPTPLDLTESPSEHLDDNNTSKTGARASMSSASGSLFIPHKDTAAAIPQISVYNPVESQSQDSLYLSLTRGAQSKASDMQQEPYFPKANGEMLLDQNTTTTNKRRAQNASYEGLIPTHSDTEKYRKDTISEDKYPLSALEISDPDFRWTYDELLKGSYDISNMRRKLDERKPKGINSLFHRLPSDEYLKNFIKNRDIVFIVDNGTSMSKFWTPATFVLETLAKNLSGLDKDGLDLLFTFKSAYTVSNAKSNAPQRFRKAMNDARPKTTVDPCLYANTDIGEILGEKFAEFQETPKYLRKKTTLIILTDGIWPASTDEDVRNKIAEFGRRLKKERLFEDRFYTIQFIRFGTNQEAIARLEFLDDKMAGMFKINDFIDTEPWTGNVYKMILGSLRTGEDNRPTAEGSLSPTSLSSASGVLSPPSPTFDRPNSAYSGVSSPIENNRPVVSPDSTRSASNARPSASNPTSTDRMLSPRRNISKRLSWGILKGPLPDK